LDREIDHAAPPEFGNQTVESLGLVDAPTPASFDSLTRLAMRIFNVPVALISIAQENNDRQFFISQQGLSDPWRTKRETPLTHSFCQHVKQTGEPLVVRDARKHPLLKSNLAIPDLNVVAYLGVPVSMPNGQVIGALCIIQNVPRDWTDREIESLKDLAECVNDEILLRADLLAKAKAKTRLQRLHATQEAISAAFMRSDLTLEDRLVEVLRISCAALNMTAGQIIAVDDTASNTVACYDPKGQCGRMSHNFLTQKVARMDEQITISDLSLIQDTAQRRRFGTSKGAYLGIPLKLNAQPYGVVEFSHPEPLHEPPKEEELSILAMVSELVGANIGVFGKIEKLERSEAALLEYIRDVRSQNSIVFAG